MSKTFQLYNDTKLYKFLINHKPAELALFDGASARVDTQMTHRKELFHESGHMSHDTTSTLRTVLKFKNMN